MKTENKIETLSRKQLAVLRKAAEKPFGQFYSPCMRGFTQTAFSLSKLGYVDVLGCGGFWNGQQSDIRGVRATEAGKVILG